MVEAKAVNLRSASLPTWLRLANGRAAIDHEIIQDSLRLFQVSEILVFQHLEFVSHHLLDLDRIVSAVVWAVGTGR